MEINNISTHYERNVSRMTEKCEHAEKHNDKCLGYQKSEWNDEPIEECENCHLYDGVKDDEQE